MRTTMVHLMIQGNRVDPDKVDLADALQRHERGYFWAENGQARLQIHGVRGGGHWCSFQDQQGQLDALGPGDPALVQSWDGGGEPMTIRGACALNERLATQVIKDFLGDGRPSKAVLWGHGVVRDSWGWVWRMPDSYREHPTARALKALADGGVSFTMNEPPLLEHLQSAIWSAITELTLMHREGLAILAQHPMEALHSLRVEGDVPLVDLQAALDAHPQLESLALIAEDAVSLPSLRAPRLLTLEILLADPIETRAERESHRAWIAQIRQQWDLPALRELADEDELNDEELDEDEDA